MRGRDLVVNVERGGGEIGEGGRRNRGGGKKKEKYGRGGSMPGHILNITDKISDRIILFVTPSKIRSVFLTCHCTDSPV